MSNRPSASSRPIAPRNPGSTIRHRMRPCRVAVELGQPLGGGPDAVNGDSPVEGRSGWSAGGDGDHLDAMAAFCQGVCQVSDVLLLPAGDWG